MRQTIIGITGAFGSGKSTASEYFKKNGFSIVALSSVLEKEAQKRKLPITRKNLQDIGNEFRELYGQGILAKKALKMTQEKHIVIDGIRNIGELEYIKKRGGVILAIVADKKIRFGRLRGLKRREKLTWPLFQRLDLRDLGVNEKITGLQTAFCIALADHFIDSNSEKYEFEEKLDNFLIKNGFK